MYHTANEYRWIDGVNGNGWDLHSDTTETWPVIAYVGYTLCYWLVFLRLMHDSAVWHHFANMRYFMRKEAFPYSLWLYMTTIGLSCELWQSWMFGLGDIWMRLLLYAQASLVCNILYSMFGIDTALAALYLEWTIGFARIPS